MTASQPPPPDAEPGAAPGDRPGASSPPDAGPHSPRPSPDAISEGLAPYRVNWRRYRRTLRFAFWLILRVGLWEIVLRRLAGERIVSRNRSARLRRWAREFRGLATEMGGVMIKLGQFISSRVDILPPAVTDELASLQDEVPTVPFDVMRGAFEAELGPLDRHFATFESEPVAAASLGQVHRARLPDGQRVVVKIQRPGIHSLVHTDLKALGVVAGWVMKFRFIARRANVPALLDEFSSVLWEELNYGHEADNVDAFRAMFAGDMGVYVPALHRDLSTRRVLTLDDVTAIKITDYDALEAAGLSRHDVAVRLVNTYLHMVFTERFFHADPHPGNLFVYPLPPDAPPRNGQHRNGDPLTGRPFYLVFVDFGMVGCLTPEIVSGLTETLIALTTRDAQRLVRSYQQLGVLLPGADLARIEQAARAAFDRVWGMKLAEISGMPLSDMADLGREFSDLLFSLPFQVPQDFLYLGRAIGILVGLSTGLDPDFEPWREIMPFVNRLLVENGETPALGRLPMRPILRDLLNPHTLRALLTEDRLNTILYNGLDVARRLADLPALADDVLRRADRGDLALHVTPAPELDRRLRALESATHRISSAIVFSGLAISTALLYTAGEHTLSAAGLVLAGLVGLRWLVGGGPGR
jgi:predicted unusual protein kinase regulating ubiquinone biosynthesis (AarF/ABC1/UbiB family)